MNTLYDILMHCARHKIRDTSDFMRYADFMKTSRLKAWPIGTLAGNLPDGKTHFHWYTFLRSKQYDKLGKEGL